MLDDYILSRLNSLKEQKEDASAQLKKINLLQEETAEKIRDLENPEEVSKEIFSPRNKKENINERKQLLKKLQSDYSKKEAELKTVIENLSADIEKYKSYIQKDADSLKKSLSDIDNQNSLIRKEDLKIILSRLQNVVTYIEENPSKAKTELTDLIYYLKALITENND